MSILQSPQLKDDKRYDQLKLGDILSKVVGGGTPSKSNENYWGGEIPWASVKDMSDGIYQLHSTVDSITEEGLKNSSTNIIPRGTVIISTRMGLGRCFRPTIDVAINQDLKALFPNEKTSSDFLIWLMAYLGTEIENMGTGTTVKGIRLEQLHDIHINLPTLAIQQKIASILSSYDDLIENNTRRIKILEEMAQTLYNEWFLKFRFPGHENVKMVESDLGTIPEGWGIKPFSAMVYINPKEKMSKDVEKPYVPMECLRTNSILVTSKEVRKTISGSKFRNGDTLFARITPCLENGKTAFVQFLSDNNSVGIGSTEFIVFRSKTLCPEYVYLLSRTDNFRENAIKSMVGASGRQRVNIQCFDNYMLPQANKELLIMFSNLMGPLFREMYLLNEKNTVLQSTRDLLLPRLISGQIDVSELDIDFGGMTA